MKDFENQKSLSKAKSSDKDKGKGSLYIGSRRALLGGILTAAVALGGQWMVGQVYSGYEARQLLESLNSAALFLGSSVVTASATILALMLTLLSLTDQTDSDFDNDFYHRIKRIGLMATVAFSGGMILLLFLSVPIKESDNVPSRWFTIIYYILITFSAVLSGLLVSLVLMLFNAVTSLIDVVRPSVNDEEDEE